MITLTLTESELTIVVLALETEKNRLRLQYEANTGNVEREILKAEKAEVTKVRNKVRDAK